MPAPAEPVSPMSPSAGPPPAGGKRWGMVFMVFLATTINYIDRANLGVAMPEISKELGLDPAAAGLLLGAFFWTYAAFQLPSGWFIDKVGARIAYAVAVIWWSLFTAATALGRGFGSLFGARLLLGVGEAPAYPTNAKVVSEWFPRRERAFATAIFDSGSRVGNALSLPIVSWIIASYGWRASFVITGLIGFVWAAFWLKMYKPPAKHPTVSAAERAYIEHDAVATAASAGPKIPWRDLFKYRAVWGMMLGFFCLNFVIYFFSTWFPTYLRDARGFDLKKLGIVGMIPAMAAIVGGYVGGFVADRLVRSGMRLSLARKIPLTIGMTLAASISFASYAQSTVSALTLLSICYAGSAFAAASVWSLPADVAPSRNYVASIGGIQNFASNLAGISITLFVGVLLQRTGSFDLPLRMAGGFALLGAISYLFILGEVAPLGSKGRTEAG